MTADPGIVQSMRELNDTVRRSALDHPNVVAANELVQQARALLEADSHHGLHGQGSLTEGVGLDVTAGNDPHAIFPYSPVVGRLNPLAPPVEFHPVDTDDEHLSLHGTVTLGAPYAGPPGLVHGGIIAMIFDELLGCTAVVNDVGAFTGTLSIRYERGTPLLAPLDWSAWIDRFEGRKVFVDGEVRAEGQRTASASGIFVRARPDSD